MNQKNNIPIQSEPTIPVSDDIINTDSSPVIVANNTKGVKYLIFVLVFAFLFGIVYFVQSKNSSSNKSKSTFSTYSQITVAGETISRQDCESIKEILKGQDARGDLCYSKEIQVNDEKITLIAVKESPKKDDCNPECDDIGLQEVYYIMRANKKLEAAPITSIELARSYSVDITGCLPQLDKSNSKQSIVKNKDQIGIRTFINNGVEKDEYGNTCTSSIDFTSASSEPFFKVSSASAKYNIVDSSECNKVENAENKPKCFARQALLRNEVSLCTNADEGTENGGTNNCILGVALRSKNTQLCDQLVEVSDLSSVSNFQKDCKNRVTNLKNDFTGTLKVIQ